MKIKLIVSVFLLFILAGCVSNGKTIFSDNQSLAVITCYWTFDPKIEDEPVSGPYTPILIGYSDDSINWDDESVSRVKVANINDNNVWFKESLWLRYQMEGCGFYDSDGDGINDYVIQLNGTDFTYTGDDINIEGPEGSTYTLKKSQTGVTLYVVIPISESPWGKAWDAQNEVETDLVPWNTIAVTDNIKSGIDRQIYLKFMDGYNFSGDYKHNGMFTPHDSSWSFSMEDMLYEKNNGVDYWIDIFVGTYDNYIDLEENYVMPLVESGSKDISTKMVYKKIDGEWKGSELWVVPISGSGI
ncbi:hypothetical protein EW093_09590 [Thiospirochaeta perfilievii]|uniref:Uncharacterized protein n=1 Tax=Thiospirochaeta perfilievii TaxID=252967 RepID=A0A5C1QDA3_9SPIO|nr:hypothetical protein [Thiospirochaeta perfilievii]QEN04949.1 hypothetical protein EW093_09590 [Thiospirochaeta perfilievii]